MGRRGIFWVVLLLAAACRPPVFTPKPAGYYRVDTPAAHTYRVFDRPGFPYTFEYPAYAEVTDDTISQNTRGSTRYWVNISFGSLGGVINLTYKAISKEEPYMKLVAESDFLSFSHHEKADYIDQLVFRFPGNGVSGILYTVGGNAATRYQFTATDSVRHFMRGALYFNVTPNADSLKPATDFLYPDIGHLLQTLHWR